jgi:hypothetical protein
MENFKRRLSGVLFLFMAVILLNGCILSFTPDNAAVVTIASGTTQDFTVTATSATSWYLDDVKVTEGKTYTYAPTDAEVGDHVLVVKEKGYNGVGIFAQIKTWNISVDGFSAITPDNTNVVVVVSGQAQDFTATCTSATSWYLDDAKVADGDAYTYSPTDADLGDHVVKVQENGPFTQSKTWNVRVITGVAGYLHYTMPDQLAYKNGGGTVADEPAAIFSGYTLTNDILYNAGPPPVYASGYSLNQFVDQNAVNTATPDPDGVLGTNDARALYSLVTRSNNDGFTTRTQFVSSGTYTTDLRWDQFILGYLLMIDYDGRAFFPTSTGVAKKYNNKWAYDIFMLRKIDVKRPDATGTIATFEVQATTSSYVDDTAYHTLTGLWTTKFSYETKSFGSYTDARVIPLTQFLTDYVTDVPGDYTYKIVAVDGSSKDGWTYADMQQAYYLVDYDLIVQVDGSNNEVSGTRINFPVRIELISPSPVAYSYSTKAAPAFAAF